MCQEDTATHERYTCASTVDKFRVEEDGTTYIVNQNVHFGTKGYERFVSRISAYIVIVIVKVARIAFIHALLVI